MNKPKLPENPVFIVCSNVSCTHNSQVKRKSIYKLSFCTNSQVSLGCTNKKGKFECLSFISHKDLSRKYILKHK